MSLGSAEQENNNRMVIYSSISQINKANFPLPSFHGMRSIIKDIGESTRKLCPEAEVKQFCININELSKTTVIKSDCETQPQENIGHQQIVPEDENLNNDNSEDEEQVQRRTKVRGILSCRKWDDSENIPSFTDSVDGEDGTLFSVELPPSYNCSVCNAAWCEGCSYHEPHCECNTEGCCEAQEQCVCLRCDDCGDIEDHCRRPKCHYCHRGQALCICPHCKYCHRQGQACVCHECDTCNEPLPLCRCTHCCICSGVVRNYPLEDGCYCHCDKCKLCDEHPNECSCSRKDLKTHEVSFRWSFVQVVDPRHTHRYRSTGSGWGDSTSSDESAHRIEYRSIGGKALQEKRVLILHGEDFHTIVVPTWRLLGKHMVERVVRIANRFVGMVKSSIFGQCYRTTRLCAACLVAAYNAERSWYNQGAYIEVTRVQHLRWMLDELAKIPHGEEPYLGIDLEGWNLGRDGTTAYLQIRDYFHEVTYLVDVLVLDDKAFTTATPTGFTLQKVLEDTSMIKLIFDCRQDSDALFDHFDVKLAGVLDIQYMYMLTMTSWPVYRPNLKNTISDHAGLTAEERKDWEATKSYPFSKQYSLFVERPCAEGLKAYATNDVRYLKKVYTTFQSQLTEKGMELAREWTQMELEDTWKEEFWSTRAFMRSGFWRCWKEVLVRGRPLLDLGQIGEW